MDLLGDRTFLFVAVADLMSQRNALESSKIEITLIKTSYISFSIALTERGSPHPIPKLPTIDWLAKVS
jgi:hypothetical protein